MKKNFLIFTPIKNTWPKKFLNNLLFASESAILKNDGNQNRYASTYICPFKWKNKKILNKDFIKLNLIFENFLNIFAIRLNKIHNTNYSQRTWRLILGPWLSNFIHIYFERYSNIKNIFLKKKIDRCIFLHFNNNLPVAYDPKEFRDSIQDDYWNQYIYQKISINFINKKNILYKKISNKSQIKIFNKAFKFYQNNTKKKYFSLKRFIVKIFNLINRKHYKYFIFGNNFGLINEIKLAWRFKQIPILSYKEKKFTKKKINEELRNKIKEKVKLNNKFNKNCFEAACDLMPTLFLENFEDFSNFKNEVNLPLSPKVIIMSHPLWYQTKLIFYVANLIENKKSTFIYGQHGGTYGLAKINWHEKFEISVADKYLTWGWHKKKNKKVKNFFLFKDLKRKNFKKKNLTIIMRGRLKRYFSSLESSTGTEVYSDYISNVSNFLFNMNNFVKEDIIVRLPPDTKNNFDFYNNLNQKFKFNNYESFSEACNKSRLIVHTSNATTFLETISSNMPSIIILNKKTNPFKNESKLLIKSLEKNNILFYDSLSAAKFVNKIWKNNIEDWWKNRSTQLAVQRFSKTYANKTSDIIEKLEKEIKNAI